jgi:hypothetical protein
MPRDFIVPLILLAGTLVAIAYGRAWMAQTADLKLSLFRPYRGDAWPIGVQEDDDFHFNWTPTATMASATGADSGGASDVRAIAHEPGAGLTDLSSFEEIIGGSVTAQRVNRISVRRLGHRRASGVGPPGAGSPNGPRARRSGR